MCTQVERFHLGPLKLDLHPWATFLEIDKRNMQKSSINFRDLFLAARGYM